MTLWSADGIAPSKRDWVQADSARTFGLHVGDSNKGLGYKFHNCPLVQAGTNSLDSAPCATKALRNHLYFQHPRQHANPKLVSSWVEIVGSLLTSPPNYLFLMGMKQPTISDKNLIPNFFKNKQEPLLA